MATWKDFNISAGEGNPDNWNRELKAWEELGGTHVTVNTMGAGLSAPDGHIGALRRFKEGVGF